jgi:hypothetical protein
MGVDIRSLSARLAASANLDSHLFIVAYAITATANMTLKEGLFLN